MTSKVLNTLKACDMLRCGDKVIVALSGGADSVALLMVLLSLKDDLGIEVFAAHVNHNLRGEESLRDEAFVKKLCKDRGVELFLRSVDVNALCAESGQSFETAGRRVRYEFFEELINEKDAFVATAHTLSDSLETALFNMVRGASFSGLSSIPYKRVKIIRPLLDVTRDEIERYIEENGLEFVDDSTNFDAEICNRNKIRHKVIPVLKSINEAAEENFLRLRESLIQADDFIKSEALELIERARVSYGFDANVLRKAHPALKSYAVKLIIESAGAGYDSRHIALLTDMLGTKGSVDLIGGFTAVIRQGVLRVVSESAVDSGEFVLADKHEFSMNGKVYSVKELTEEEIVHRNLSTKVISCDKIKGDAVFRTRQEGDRFAPLKRGITKDLRKLQNELKIPAEQRPKLLLLEGDGEVLWAEGIGVSEVARYKGSKGILIEIREDKDYA